MADTIALELMREGETEKVLGDNPHTTLDRENTIEVLSLTQPLRRSFDRGSGRATARRYYEPLRFTKRIDRSSPLLRQFLIQNRNLRGKFMWFRPITNGSGDTEMFFTIEFTQGAIVGVETWLRDTLDPSSANLPPIEEVQLVFDTITWTFVDGGVTHTDTWNATV
ncbi:MAG: type VI secretion system tube protein TssD [Gemmatimonadales bacterium]